MSFMLLMGQLNWWLRDGPDLRGKRGVVVRRNHPDAPPCAVHSGVHPAVYRASLVSILEAIAGVPHYRSVSHDNVCKRFLVANP